MGSLVVSLSLEHAEFTKGLDKSSQEALKFAKKSQDSFDKFERSAKNSIGSVVQNVIGLAAAYVSVSSAIGALNNSINTLAKLDDMAQKTGSSVESLSRLQKVASQFGADFDAIDVAVGKLAKGLAGIDDEGGKTAKALNAIGISQKFVKDNDPSEVMIEVAKKLQNYQDGASKAALATDLFGKAGIELLPYLNDVADNVDRFAGVSGEAAAKAAKLKDDLGALKVSFSQLVDEVTIGILPAMNSFIGKLNQLLQFRSIFSSVGGIDEKDYDKEIAQREKDFIDLKKSRDNLSKPTLTNKINDFIYGDVRDLNDQLTIIQDEVRALKNLKAARDALKASPYVSPNDEKKKLEYKGADVESKLNAFRDAAAAKEAAANKKLFEERLKELQREVSEEFENVETVAKFKVDKNKESLEAMDKQRKEFAKMDEKFNDVIQRSLDKRYNEELNRVKKLEEEKRREFEKTVDGINQTFREGFAGLINGGKGSWKAFTQSLLTTFKTTVADQIYRMFAQPFVVKLVASILGVGGAGGSSLASAAEAIAGQGGGSFGFGSLKDIGSVITKGFKGANIAFEQGIQQFGTFVTEFGGVGESIGGFISQYSSAISNVLPYAGAALSLLKGDFKGAAFQAAGVAIGSAIGGPIGGAIGSALGGIVGGLFGGKKQPPRTVTQLPEVGQAYSGSINALLGGFDMQGNATASAQYKGRAGGSGYGTLNTNIGGVSNVLQTKDKGAYSEASLKAFVNRVLGVELVKGIQSSSLSAGVKKFFDGLIDPQVVNQTSVTLIGLNQALKNMPPIFDAIRNAIDTTAYKVSVAQLESTFANTMTFTSLFYTEAENFATFTNQLQAQLTSLNTALPTSRDAYRQLVDSINVNSEATFSQYSGLVALAPAMDLYFKQLQQQADGINQVNQALADGLDANLFSTYADFASAKVNVASGLSPSGFIGERTASEKDNALAIEVKSLREQGANQQTILETIAAYLYNMEKIYKQWNGDGLPAERVI